MTDHASKAYLRRNPWRLIYRDFTRAAVVALIVCIVSFGLGVIRGML